MIELSFPTIKLGKYIKEIKCKVKNTDLKQDDLIVYGVTNTEGITVTNNKASDDLSNYTVLNENQFAYNPYRVNVGSIGLSTTGTFGVVSPAYVVFEATKEISSEFLLYYLKSDLGINLIKWYGDRGGVRSALRFVDLKEIDFPDIDFEKQMSIFGKMKEIDSKLSEFNENLSLENISLLRQAILQQAIEGKLCEQDPTDEPASVLLKKIKAEKEKLIAEKKIKKQKELPPITDEEKPFELPQGWEWCRLGTVAHLITDGEHSTPKRIPHFQGYYLLSARNVINNNILLSDVDFVDEIEYNRISKRCNPVRNDILISCSGSVGRVCKVSDDNKYVMVRSAALIKVSQINVDFLVYMLQSRLVQAQIIKKQKQTAQANLFLGAIEHFSLPIPPLAEQLRIVEKVDKLMFLCDELEQEVTSAKKYASQLMEAVLQEAFSNKTDKKQDNIIAFVPPIQEESIQTDWSAAARGDMRVDTWKHLVGRANQIIKDNQ